MLPQWESASNSLFRLNSTRTEIHELKKWKWLQKSQTISDLQLINNAKLHHINHNGFFPVYVLLENGFVFMTTYYFTKYVSVNDMPCFAVSVLSRSKIAH